MTHYPSIKKLYLLTALCALTAVRISASGYFPLLADGKQWHEKDQTEAVDYDFCYAIEGDTLVDGETWKKLTLTLTITPRNELGSQYGESATTYGPSVTAWLQEHDGKVYLSNRNRRKSLLYDFTLNAGDTAYEDESIVQQVTITDSILVDGRMLKRLWLTEKSKLYDQTRQGQWVESIGCNYGLEGAHGWETMPSWRMDECTIEGKSIFTAADFKMPSISDVSRCDINGDGKVDVADIAKIIDCMARQTGK